MTLPVEAATRIVRPDAVAKVTGAAKFGIDTELPGAVYGRVVRADRAHAHIAMIRRNAALASPGCLAVLSAEDLTGLFPRFGHIVPDHSILAESKVRYFGEPVALVLAESSYAAADAHALVEVEYDDLPAVFTPAAALVPGAPRVHEGDYQSNGAAVSVALYGRKESNNTAHRVSRTWGDPDSAFARSHVVVQSHTTSPMLYPYAMEPYNASAQYVNGCLEVVTPAQHPFMVALDLSRTFGLPLSKIRVRVPYMAEHTGPSRTQRSSPWLPSVRGSWLVP